MNLRAYYDKLEPRERKLLTVLGAVLIGGIFLLLPIALYGALSGKRSRNDDIRTVLAAIDGAHDQIAERKARHDALIARYAKAAPPLAGFIEEAARANNLAVPESQDKPDVPHGRRYTERITVVKMHKIGMKNLAKMLEQVEHSGYPVAVTRLNVKPRAGEPDSYEVELGVSAFDRKSDGPAPGAAAAPAASEAGGQDDDL